MHENLLYVERLNDEECIRDTVRQSKKVEQRRERVIYKRGKTSRIEEADPRDELDTKMDNYSDETDEFMRTTPKVRQAIREIQVNKVSIDEADDDSPVEDGFEMMARKSAVSNAS